MSKGSRIALMLAGGLLVSSGSSSPRATVVDFTSSTAFDAATVSDTFTIEQYASGVAGETICKRGHLPRAYLTSAAGR